MPRQVKPPEAVQLDDAPDLAGAVIGFAGWVAMGEGDGLGDWTPGVNHTTCPIHDAPDMNCQCGIKGYYSLTDLRLTTQRAQQPLSDVVGVVKGWGKIAVEDNYWRAEHAEIVALGLRGLKRDDVLSATSIVDEDGDPVPMDSPLEGRLAWLHEVGKHFNVPIVPYPKLPEVAALNGRGVPDEMKPKAKVRKQRKAQGKKEATGSEIQKREPETIRVVPASSHPISIVPAIIAFSACIALLILFVEHV